MIAPDSKAHVILGLLARSGEAYGLELVSKAEGRLKRAALYTQLHRMVARGLLASSDHYRHGTRLRVYRMTTEGQRMLLAVEAAVKIAKGG